MEAADAHHIGHYLEPCAPRISRNENTSATRFPWLYIHFRRDANGYSFCQSGSIHLILQIWEKFP